MQSRILSIVSVALGALLVASCGGTAKKAGDEDTQVDTGTDGIDGDVPPDEVPSDTTPDGEDPATDPPGDGIDGDVPEEATDVVEEDVGEEEAPGPDVDCGGSVCAPTEECCFTTGPAGLACVASGTCAGGVLDCDEEADCPPDQVCCHDPPTDIGAACVPSCDGIIVCGSSTECPEGDPYCCPAMGGLFDICRDTPC